MCSGPVVVTRVGAQLHHADDARRTRSHDQAIRLGSSRSIFWHSRSAMAIAAQSAIHPPSPISRRINFAHSHQKRTQEAAWRPEEVAEHDRNSPTSIHLIRLSRSRIVHSSLDSELHGKRTGFTRYGGKPV